VTETSSNEGDNVVNNSPAALDLDLEESSVSSQDGPPSPSVRSLPEVNTSVTVVLGGKKARTIEFTTPLVLASDILERLESMLSDKKFEKLNLPTDVSQIRLTRKDQLLQSGDEVKDEDVIYVLAKSEVSRGTCVDDEKETRRSRPRRNIHEILGKLNPVRRQRSRIRPLLYKPVFNRATKSDDSGDIIPRMPDMEITSWPSLMKSLPEEITQESMSSIDFSDEEVMRPSPKSSSLKSLTNQLQELETESNDIKVENTELRNLLKKTLTKTELGLKKLNKMESNLKQRKFEVCSLSTRNEELLTENKRLVEERCILEQKVKELQVQKEDDKKHTDIMGMGVALPKKVPKDPEQLENTIDALQTLIMKLRSVQVENYKSRMTCTICYERNWNTALIPCGHCLCDVCARRIASCPQCRQLIKRRQKISRQTPRNLKNFVL